MALAFVRAIQFSTELLVKHVLSGCSKVEIAVSTVLKVVRLVVQTILAYLVRATLNLTKTCQNVSVRLLITTLKVHAGLVPLEKFIQIACLIVLILTPMEITPFVQAIFILMVFNAFLAWQTA